MDFPKAIGTKKFALLALCSNPFPTSSVTFVRNPEVFIRGFKMMDLQRLSTPVITATSTSAT
jgi:hypothetical protein